MPRVVTLTTDFGPGSGYVSEMKGRLPHARSAFTIVRTYGEAPPGTPVALVGSQGLIEAAVVEGRADRRFSALRGTPVEIPPA